MNPDAATYCEGGRCMLQEVAAAGLKANEWVKHVSEVMNGKGGGKDMSAQATGTNATCLEQVLQMATDYAKMKLV